MSLAKMTGYKINIQSLIVLYNSNRQLENVKEDINIS